MDIPGLINVVCAMLPIIGTGLVWWQANLLKKAKQCTEVNEGCVECTLKAFKAMADSVKKSAINAL